MQDRPCLIRRVAQQRRVVRPAEHVRNPLLAVVVHRNSLLIRPVVTRPRGMPRGRAVLARGTGCAFHAAVLAVDLDRGCRSLWSPKGSMLSSCLDAGWWLKLGR